MSPEGDTEASEDDWFRPPTHPCELFDPAKLVVVFSRRSYASHPSPARRGDPDGEGASRGDADLSFGEYNQWAKGVHEKISQHLLPEERFLLPATAAAAGHVIFIATVNNSYVRCNVSFQRSVKREIL